MPGRQGRPLAPPAAPHVTRLEAPLPAPARRAFTAVRRALDGCQLQGQEVVVAVSGGGDSVFLLLALAALAPPRRLRLRVAHLDHGWRGPAGAADAAWVAGLAAELGLPYHGGQVDAPAVARAARRSPEEAARQLRYRFLAEVCLATGAPVVATGHTADDQVETVILALLRGSGLHGLRGMTPTSPLPVPGGSSILVVRPLLDLSRDAVRQALASLGRTWREDATNLDRRRPRNRLRLEILPLLEAVAPGFRRAVRRTATLAGEAGDYLAQTAGGAAATLFEPTTGGWRARRQALLALHPALRSEVLRWAVARLSGGSRPEWAHIQGGLATIERGRGRAVAWLAPGVQLRLAGGWLLVEASGEPTGAPASPGGRDAGGDEGLPGRPRVSGGRQTPGLGRAGGGRSRARGAMPDNGHGARPRRPGRRVIPPRSGA